MKSRLKVFVTLLLSSFIASQSHSADDSKQLSVTEETFRCLSELAATGRFFVGNILGNLDDTLAVANSENGGSFPPGSLVTLVPVEAMIKHEEGWNPATNDWEFFLLDVSEEGSRIAARGGAEVVNQAGSCFGCHQLARPEWDLVCGENHGFAPLPFSLEQIRDVQKSDPRCMRKD